MIDGRRADSDNGDVPKRASLWPRIVAIGCGGVLVLALVAAVLVGRSWPTLNRYYQQAKSNLAEIMAVQATLQKKYSATVHVSVNWRGGVQGSILSVTLLNPPFLDQLDVDGESGRLKALEVAVAARDSVTAPGYDNYEVILSRERGAGITLNRNWTFRFTSSELPTAKAESGR